MRRTRTAEARPVVSGRPWPLSEEAVVRAAQTVLRAERRRALLSLTFVGRDRMRALNLQWKGKRELTDVLAFALESPGGRLAGDIYICPWAAAREARARGIPVREELRRLVVHGVLHVLGYDHPSDGHRLDSPMWRRQERYVRSLG